MYNSLLANLSNKLPEHILAIYFVCVRIYWPEGPWRTGNSLKEIKQINTIKHIQYNFNVNLNRKCISHSLDNTESKQARESCSKLRGTTVSIHYPLMFGLYTWAVIHKAQINYDSFYILYRILNLDAQQSYNSHAMGIRHALILQVRNP